ncbi:MFS transporter, partial [Mycobacterium szulgai]|nr:MFS transporter [Mycobacterium szulgai]
MIYTLIEGPNIGWLSVRTARFVIAAIMVLLLWWLERHTSHPALDWSIFANRRFSGGSVAV